MIVAGAITCREPGGISRLSNAGAVLIDCRPMATDPPSAATTDPRHRTASSRLWWCLLIVTMTVGCGSAPPDKRGSTLTQAADEAKETDPEKKKVLVTTPKDDQDEDVEETAVAAVGVMAATTTPADSPAMPADSSTWSESPLAEPGEVEDRARFALSAIGGFGTVETSQFEGFGSFGIGGSFMEGPMRCDLWLLYLPTSLSEESGVVDALVDEYEVAADFRFRYRFTPRHTFAGIYGLLGARWGSLDWTYQNGVVVADDYGNPQTIYDDWLTYYAGYLGVGFAPMQTDHIMLNVDFSVGLKTFDSYTHEGFNQDLFDDWIGFGQILFSADYRF